MTNQNQDPLNPKFDLNNLEGQREFLEWLFNPEVDKAIQQFIKDNGGEPEDN